MNVSSTRKVSSSSSPIKRTERHYAPGAEGHPFVEVVDTTNNVLVRDAKIPRLPSKNNLPGI